MNFRNTEQKKLIITDIENRYDHPTAQMIYDSISLVDPNVGIATVYRNLKTLVEMGKIKKIMTNDNIAHYDRICNNHIHLVCSSCGKIIDLESNFLDNNEQFKKLDFQVSIQDIQINGICQDCKE